MVVVYPRTNTRKRAALCATPPRQGMAVAEDAVKAAASLYYGEMEGGRIYQRATFIHEMSCGQVGAHLYRRMCCAGRSVRSAPLGGRLSGRGSWATAGEAVNLFHSFSRNRKPPE